MQKIHQKYPHCGMPIITVSYIYLVEILILFQECFSRKQLPVSRNPEKYGGLKEAQ
jgi:hypothetical protein